MMLSEYEYKQLKKKDSKNKYRTAQFKKGMYAGYLEYFEEGSCIIEQAKKEAREDFAKKLKDSIDIHLPQTKNYAKGMINGLLKEYEEI